MPGNFRKLFAALYYKSMKIPIINNLIDYSRNNFRCL